MTLDDEIRKGRGLEDLLDEMQRMNDLLTRPQNPLLRPDGFNTSADSDPSPASALYEQLSELIESFEAALDNQHEVGIRLASFGSPVILHLIDIGYADPSLIWLNGETDTGDPVRLVQSVGQLSILVTKVPKRGTGPKRHVGFASHGEKQ